MDHRTKDKSIIIIVSFYYFRIGLWEGKIQMNSFKVKPVIIGEKVLLRPFQKEDIPAMEECLKDTEVLKFTGSSSDFDKNLITQWYNTRNEQVDRLDLAIVIKSENTVVGEVVINEYNEAKHSVNFRILIGPKGRNQGFGTEATRLVIDYVFQNTDLKQITLGVYAFNPRAKRVYEKIGFIVDSIDEDELKFEGQMVDSINMVLARDKWQMSTEI
jgi:RimJ/RimL family protein N-acetyltransferase